ncbi:hypothetical protein G7046_g7923 [Stylonectria norvegica]|nr:hypothetical protein G7046_g7923 [Stylonectria norvegica]
MGDSDETPEQSAIPSWQRTEAEEVPATAEAKPNDDDHLEVARRFLDDEAVRDAPREKKIKFLKAKGIEEADIQSLLGNDEAAASPETP